MSVRRYIYIVIAALYALCVRAHTPLSPETHHFVALNGDVGLSTLMHNIPDFPTSAGVNANFGVGYRLYRNNFLFNTGLEAAYQLNANKLDNLDFTLPMRDTEGDLFNMHVLITKSSDRTHMLNLNIPLLFGGEWGRFYFLVGPKVAINVWGAASSDAVYSTYGEYERAYDDFYDMPNHQFESNKHMSSGTLPMKWQFNVMGHLEIGGRLGPVDTRKGFHRNPQHTRMYLAAYVDCGVLNIHSSNAGGPIFEYRETPDEGLKFYIQPLMLSSLADNAIVRNLNVGIKYTICLEIPVDGKAFVYDWYEMDERTKMRRGGNQTIKF